MRNYYLTVYGQSRDGLGTTYNLGRSSARETAIEQSLILLGNYHCGTVNNWAYEEDGVFLNEPILRRAFLTATVLDSD